MSETPSDPCSCPATEGANTGDYDPLAARAAEDTPALPDPLSDPQLSVTLPQSTWDAIVTLLGQRPYAEVAPYIVAIDLQTSLQLAELRLIQAIWAAPLPMH